VEVTEEDQAQAVAQGLGEDVVDLVAGIGIPRCEAVAAFVTFAQGLQLVGLARAAFSAAQGKHTGDFGLLEKLEQLVQRQLGVLHHPALLDQRAGGGDGAADLGVAQLGGAE